jgi:PAT family beta-lactamase induction signal transducer AmpG
MVSSQMTLVVTYGVLIIVAGFFEVFFRSYQKAWAMESSLVAGGFMIFCILNFIVLPRVQGRQPYRYESVADTVKNEWHIVSRIRQKPHIFAVLLSLFFLLLPQALMFNTRVFFLLASSERGGLDCSFQDVGFAQGTIGVLAFSLGIALGRSMMREYGNRSMFGVTAVVLTLSPVPYLLMALYPQIGNMLMLCCMTFVAQLFFGFGLNVCRVYVPYISEQRYRNVTNFLYLPMVASLMVVPMTLSGWLCMELGYQTFFKLCVAIAPVAWIVLWISRTKRYLLN